MEKSNNEQLPAHNETLLTSSDEVVETDHIQRKIDRLNKFIVAGEIRLVKHEVNLDLIYNRFAKGADNVERKFGTKHKHNRDV